MAFVSPNYKTSYAALMELMSACERQETPQKTVLPIYIGNADCNDFDNTGLGTRRFPDYSTNELWDKELKLFNKLFNYLMIKSNDTITDKESAKLIYPYSNNEIINYDAELDKDAVFENESYWKDKHIAKDDIDAKNKHWNELFSERDEKGEMYLNKKGNADLVSMILSGINKNNIDGVNKSIADAVYDKLNEMRCGDVFDTDLVESDGPVTYHVTVRNGENKNMIPVENGGLVPKQDAGVRDGFVFIGWYVADTDEKWDFSNPVHVDMEIYAKWKTVAKPAVSISEETTLKEFQGYFENLEFLYALREVRAKCKRQLFDYLMASLLRGCDKDPGKDEAVIDRDRYNYCTYVVSSKLDPADPQIGASYYTWTSNARKALKKEDMPSNYFNERGKVKSGQLGDLNEIFEALDRNMTIGEVLEKYKAKEKGFVTKDQDGVFEAWKQIKGIKNQGGKTGVGELLDS